MIIRLLPSAQITSFLAATADRARNCPSLGDLGPKLSAVGLRDGHVGCLSETGSRHGDPLAALSICLGFQYPLPEITHELRVYSANVPEPIRADRSAESIADRIARDDVRMQLGRIYATDPERRLQDHAPDREPMSPADLAQYAQAR
eukprot:gene11511-8195_t